MSWGNFGSGALYGSGGARQELDGWDTVCDANAPFAVCLVGRLLRSWSRLAFRVELVLLVGVLSPCGVLADEVVPR